LRRNLDTAQAERPADFLSQEPVFSKAWDLADLVYKVFLARFQSVDEI